VPTKEVNRPQSAKNFVKLPVAPGGGSYTVQIMPKGKALGVSNEVNCQNTRWPGRSVLAKPGDISTYFSPWRDFLQKVSPWRLIFHTGFHLASPTHFAALAKHVGDSSEVLPCRVARTCIGLESGAELWCRLMRMAGCSTFTSFFRDGDDARGVDPTPAPTDRFPVGRCLAVWADPFDDKIPVTVDSN